MSGLSFSSESQVEKITYKCMLCVLKESNLVEEFLQGIGYRKGIEGNEIKEVVSTMLAIIKQEIHPKEGVKVIQEGCKVSH